MNEARTDVGEQEFSVEKNQMETPHESVDAVPRSHSMIQSLLSKAAVLGLGMTVVFWLGWPIPKQGPRDSSPSHASKIEMLREVDDQAEEGVNAVSIIPHEEVGRLTLLNETEAGRVSRSHRIDINQGTTEEIAALPGIGPVLAKRIIAYRQSHGRFQGVDDLKVIPGIGQRRLAQLRPFVMVNPHPK